MKSGWSVSFVNRTAEKELFELSSDLKAKFLHIMELLMELGPQQVGMPHIRPLENRLWEVRLKGKGTIARSIYVLASGKRIVILHTFIKKTEQTPRKAIQIALERIKEVRND